MLQNLPLGSSDFSTLRANNEIYVDKTLMVYQLARQRGKFFLARPRRFGKSLLISTFESLFKNGLRDFQGLAIENLWRDKTYPVVRLDFSELKEFLTIEEFKRTLHNFLTLNFKSVGFNYDPTGIDDSIFQLSAWFKTLTPSSLVILIDEYYAPLTACLDKPEIFEEVRTILGRLFFDTEVQ